MGFLAAMPTPHTPRSYSKKRKVTPICILSSVALRQPPFQWPTAKKQPARPISYDLAHQILVGVDARVAKVEITDLHESTYYAEVHLIDDEGKTHVLDARPSDAIALALRFSAPIYAAAEILQEAGHAPPGNEEPLQAKTAVEPDPTIDPEPMAESIAVSQEDPSIVTPPAVDPLEELKKCMRQAIAEEVYEEAARLRDEISRLEEEE